ncbi:hypothetical protein [Salipiger sp.]|uniref:hypothetical protein n=1 Tax=Salipiger sp. TaxID=2078585 RepID=UPI003A9808A9
MMQLTFLSSIGLATFLALFLAQFPRFLPRAAAAPTPTLLTPAACRRPPSDLPALSRLRADLAAWLTAPDERRDPVVPHEPESPAQARSRVFRRIMTSWHADAVEQLDERQLQSLWLLRELISADCCRAGELAQRFRKPDAVLAIRDRIREIDAHHARFEAQRAAFLATSAMWARQSAAAQDRPLVDALRALAAPDPDLWHKVIAEHDLADPAQASAALWCARQTGCERASVALYLSRIAEADRLSIALRSGETDWLDGVHAVIRSWNAGVYTGRTIGLAPEDAASHAAPALSAQLDTLAEQTGDPRWPEPDDIFVAYHGTAARPRDIWDLRTGRLTAPPRLEHYIEME